MDIKYINYSLDKLNEVLNLWNDEVGFIYPISKTLGAQNINHRLLSLESSFLAYDGDTLVGFIIGKVYDNDETIIKYLNTAFITLMYVKRKYRRNKIGTNLLNLFEENVTKLGCNKISVGSDLDCFFPGISNDFDNLTDLFFRSKGYNVSYYTHDMIKKLSIKDVETFNELDLECLNKYKFKYASFLDKDIVLKFFKKNFYGRWYYEAYEYFEEGKTFQEYLICLDGNKVIGFIRTNKGVINKISYNITWKDRFDRLIGIGPLGVDTQYRGQNIGKALILYALKDGYENGNKDALIDWTGLVSLYQKYGFETWKCYQYASKKI